jgi:DNA-binding PadR family transcriptional regulator
MELLILYALSKKELTMYAVSKAIMDSFAAYTQPSFGAIKPALTRLEKGNFIRSRKAMSDGGKLSGFYSTTSEGQEELKKLLLEKISSNPLQFNSNARIKLSCASFLDKDERSELFFQIKTKAQEHKYAAEKILENESNSLSFYQKIILDNTICEYENFINIIEGLEKENIT